MHRSLLTVGAAAALLATTVAGAAAQSPAAASPGTVEGVIASLPPELGGLYDHYAGSVTLANAPDVSGNPGPWKFCYSESYQGNPWRVALTNETKRLADEFIKAGILSEFVMTDANGDVPLQITQIQSFIDQGCDVILTIPGSTSGLDGVIEAAYKAGIPVITNSGAATSPYAINVDSNWYRWGYDMMNAIGNEIGEGNVLVVEGIAGAPIVAMQAEGREAALAQFPGLKVVATVNGDWTPTTTQTVVTQTLATNPAEIDAVWTSGSESRLVTEAFKAAGREVPLVTGSISGDALGYWNENPDGYRFTGNAVLPVPTANSGFRAALRTIMGQQPLLNTILVDLPAITQADLPDWFSACMTPDSASVFPQPATDPYPEEVFNAYFAAGAATPPYDYANTPDPCG